MNRRKRRAAEKSRWVCELVGVEEGDTFAIYVVVNGKRIAKRGHPDTPQAGTWVSLEPGWQVYSSADLSTLTVERDGVLIQ
jgi:hypothetical protein